MKRNKIYFCKYCCNAEERIKVAEGYWFEYGNLCYALSKIGSFWHATELSSGLLVGIRAKRLSDFPEVFKEWEEDGRLTAIEYLVLSKTNEKVCKAQKEVKQYMEEYLKQASA